MKTVITTVGVSLFKNYRDEYDDLDAQFEHLGYDSAYSDTTWQHVKLHREKISKNVFSWAKGNTKASAEVKSLTKIQQKVGDVRTVLVTSNTLLGYLAGEILQTLLPRWDINVDYVQKIQGLDVNNTDGSIIKKGFDNYIEFLLGTTYTGMAYNISGGYKAIIPISTLIASWKRVSLYYIYEDSDYLVEIPPFPFHFDLNICETFKTIFQYIEKNAIIDEEEPTLKKFFSELAPGEKEIFNSLTIRDNGITFSTIGQIIWKDYKQSLPLVLIKSDKIPQEKPIKIREDHGKDILTEFSNKLCQCEYVEGIVNSLPFNPKESNFIHTIKDNGLIEVVLYWTDPGYGLVVQTTGKNKKETEEIAKILRRKYE